MGHCDAHSCAILVSASVTCTTPPTDVLASPVPTIPFLNATMGLRSERSCLLSRILVVHAIFDAY